MLCDSLRGQGRTANAACQCKKAMQEQKDFILGYVVLGHTYHDQGKVTWAKGTLDHALRVAEGQARKLMKERGLSFYFPENFVQPDASKEAPRKEKFREDAIRALKELAEKQRQDKIHDKEKEKEEQERKKAERFEKIRQMEKERYQASGAFNTFGAGPTDNSGEGMGAFGTAHPHDIEQFGTTTGIDQHDAMHA
eukprot:TRINITY_DN788_c0_g1_i1.p2 TRINITY_DN788_c0_g1~~TRINITY_DN788_c0_g1_i1.p2  ORF type:complete len:195 (-),score=70.11 TRINITY_DN788_c0_g1_i1:48-632(-)